MAPFEVTDDVPSEGKIEDAVLGLKSKKAPGLTGTRANHLKECLTEAHKESHPKTKCWSSLVELV
jgi:hypothetical protein